MGLIRLEEIEVDPDVQPRAGGNNEELVAEYAEEMKAGTTFPEGRVFDDGKKKWLSRGFHRYAARAAAGFDTIACEVVQGTRFDAILDAVGSNAEHGLRRTNKDKRRAVAMLLQQKRWAKLSDRWIADKCGVHHTMVGRTRKQLVQSTTTQNGQATRQGRAGRTYVPAPDSPPAVCPNCGHDKFDEDGDCTKCYEPGSEIEEVTEEEFQLAAAMPALLLLIRDERKRWPVENYSIFVDILNQLAEETKETAGGN